MADKRGESLEVARLLARAFNAYNHVTEPSATADSATLETMTGEAFRLRYDGRWYLVLVVPDENSPLMQAEFSEYRD